MMKRLLTIATGLLALWTVSCRSEEEKMDRRVESYLSKMTLEEKIAIIHAQSKFSSPGVPRLGIPELRADDGPHDVRSPEQLLADALAAVKGADRVIFVGGLNKSKFQAWYLGSETGHALSAVLSGKVNPSGKLPFTFPVRLEDGPIKSARQYPGIAPADGEKYWQEEYTEGLYVGYRWYEAQNIRPLFAFGHGLSYTAFEYGQAKLSSRRFHGDKVTVSIPVTNTGKVAGAEVVQVYVSDRRALSFFDPVKHEWVAEEGDFDILIGSASDDIRTSVKLTL